MHKLALNMTNVSTEKRQKIRAPHADHSSKNGENISIMKLCQIFMLAWQISYYSQSLIKEIGLNFRKKIHIFDSAPLSIEKNL